MKASLSRNRKLKKKKNKLQGLEEQLEQYKDSVEEKSKYSIPNVLVLIHYAVKILQYNAASLMLRKKWPLQILRSRICKAQ